MGTSGKSQYSLFENMIRNMKKTLVLFSAGNLGYFHDCENDLSDWVGFQQYKKLT